MDDYEDDYNSAVRPAGSNLSGLHLASVILIIVGAVLAFVLGWLALAVGSFGDCFDDECWAWKGAYARNVLLFGLIMLLVAVGAIFRRPPRILLAIVSASMLLFVVAGLVLPLDLRAVWVPGLELQADSVFFVCAFLAPAAAFWLAGSIAGLVGKPRTQS